MKLTEEQINDIYERIDTTQNDDWLMDLAKAIIEAHEKSKWVELDKEDESTYPPEKTEIIVWDGESVKNDVFDRGLFAREWATIPYSKVTHWQPLPKF